MNLSNYCKRNLFVELDNFSSQINRGGQQPRSRDPFESDPFKVHSLNFRYAEKPSYTVSNRGKGMSKIDACQVKKIYYNHDHAILKCDKENLHFGHPRQQSQASTFFRNSPSSPSLSVAPSVLSSSEKQLNSTPSLMSRLRTEPVNAELRSRMDSMNKKVEFKRSKPTIGQTTVPPNSFIVSPTISTTTKKHVFKPSSDSMTGISVNHKGSCEITIKFSGSTGNRVHINQNDDNVEINLTKPKKTKSMKTESPHVLKPSRSYTIHREDTTPDLRKVNLPQSDQSEKDLRDSSTHSMIPHREEKSVSQQSSFNPSFRDSIRAYAGAPLRSSFCHSQTSIPIRYTKQRASILEKILSSNPIVQQPKTKDLFTRSKSFFVQGSSPTDVTTKFTRSKMNLKPY